MTENHPITPPPELVRQWIDTDEGGPNVISRIATRAAQWGADQELEACCEWLTQGWDEIRADKLRAARRPKPPSLKEQALAALNEIEDSYGGPSTQEILIRRALEQLPDHE
jgi:hypothetical protein